MNNERKQKLIEILKEQELQKKAQEFVDQLPDNAGEEISPEGEQVADQIFNQFLNEIDMDSVT